MFKKILVSFLFLLFFALLNSAQACYTLDRESIITDGYGTSYNFFSEEGEQLVQGTCFENRINVQVGNGSDSTFVYRLGYFYSGDSWQEVELNGEMATEDWIRGSASQEIVVDMTTNQAQYFVAYTCQQIEGEWKCGCADEACDVPSSPRWQLQTFRYSGDLVCQDADRDGYGVANIAFCDNPSLVDCNDNDDDIYPGAEEVCGNEIDEDCNGEDLICGEEEEIECFNQDGDDYDTCPIGVSGGDGRPADCNDTVSYINPGALETCDGNDNNCNLMVDEGCDDDGDAYCDRNLPFFNAPLEICENSISDNFLDCDDRSSDFHPGALETCDGRDNDCDQEVDEGAACCVDEDEDGFNNCSPSLEGDDGEIADCNDNDSGIYPGQEERCDGLDNNCNNRIDEGDVCCVDFDRDGYDNCEINTLGDDELEIDCQDEVFAVNPGAEEVCDGIDNNCDGEIDDNGCSCLAGQSRNCGTDVGLCEIGIQYCVSGSWGTCVDEVPAQSELCDGLDNDCDGEVDNACDTIDPLVNSFVIRTQDQQEAISNFTVTDNHGLAQVELWRTTDLNGEPNESQWAAVRSLSVSGLQYMGVLNDSPGEGVYWYGLHVVDTVGNWGAEPLGPIRLVFSNCLDVDEDGYDNCAIGEVGGDDYDLDCDDNEYYAHPGGLETCDTVDNDCDGEIDEECDVDGDGHCASNKRIYRNNSMCENTVVTVDGQYGDDCNDFDQYINPRVNEACDGVDNNCNNQIDENCSCINGQSQNCGTSVGLCQSGEQSCEDGQWGDCVGMIGPAEELCDGLDNDCDGQDDNDCDQVLPQVESFSASFSEPTNRVEVQFRVSDDYALGRVELWRTTDYNGQANSALWQRVSEQVATGNSFEGSFSDQPGYGVYWYGIHVIDQYSNEGDEDGPIQIIVSRCQDVDEDGFDDCASSDAGDDGFDFDCNDQNALINANAEEVCDGVDNNCNNISDEVCECMDGQSQVCGSDVGLCETGSRYCVDGSWSDVCQDEVASQTEICGNGIDEDCNGSDSVCEEEYPLVVSIEEPTNDSFPENSNIYFSVLAIGGQAPYEYTLESNIAGPLYSGGSSQFSIDSLMAGEHQITLRVRDSLGEEVEQTRTLYINSQESLGINYYYPVDGDSAMLGSEVYFGVYVEGGAEPYTFSWTSSIDGQFSDLQHFSLSSLSLGTHRITVSVLDSASITMSRSFDFSVVNDLVVSVEPAYASFEQGEEGYLSAMIAFLGEGARDLGEGISFIWSSNRSGVVGYGDYFVTSGLPIGIHTITVLANDGQGNTGEATVVVEIREAVCEDSDGDGYGLVNSITCEHWGEDCDDSNEYIYPGAEEICPNEIDEDCDGSTTDCPFVMTVLPSALDGAAVNWGEEYVIQVQVEGGEARDLRVSLESPDESGVRTIYLYDDGEHFDGQAGDNVFGNEIDVVYDEGDYVVDLQLRHMDYSYQYADNIMSFSIVNQPMCTPVSVQGGSEDKLDFVFIAEQYSADRLPVFVSRVEAAMNYILATDPFDVNASRINFWRIDSEVDLECSGYPNYCSDNSAANFIRTICPYDRAVIFSDRSYRSYASYGGNAYVSNGSASVTLHELGHSFGSLWDEYEDAGVAAERSASESYVNISPNCSYYSTCDKWSEVEGAGCYDGCFYRKGIYRSIYEGTMRRSAVQDFGPLNVIKLQEKLDNYQ